MFPTSRVRRRGAVLVVSVCLALAAAVGAQTTDPTTNTQQPQPTPSPQATPAPTLPLSPTPASTPPTPAPSPARASDDEADAVERVDASATNVLMSAVDRNRRYVTTLRREDVRVFENGVAQELSVFQHQTDLPLSLVILVDTSASQEKVLPDEQRAATAFVNSVLRPGKDRAAVLSFTGLVQREQDLTGDLALLRDAIARVRVRYTYNSPECDPDLELTEEQDLLCRTGVWHALWVSVENVLSRTPENTRRAVVLLSDGDDTSRGTRSVARVSREDAIEHAVRHNTAVYSVGIRDRDFPDGELRKGMLEKLSEMTGGRAFFPRDPSELGPTFASIEQELRSQYFLSYTPANGAGTDAFRKIKIEIVNPDLRKQKLRLLYREGYYARPARSGQ